MAIIDSFILQTKPYTPLVQRPDMCAITCFMMILYQRGYGLHDMEKLAIYFNATVGEKYSDAFEHKFMSGSGIKTVESDNQVNQYFKDREIKLKCTVHKKSDIKDMREFIKSNLLVGNNLWLEYHNKPVWNYENAHDSLIEGFDVKNDEVILVDPYYFRKSRMRMKVDLLFESMDEKYGYETGVLVIENK